MIHELTGELLRPIAESLGGTAFEMLQDPDAFAFRSPFGVVIVLYLYDEAPPFTALHAIATWSKSFEEDRRGDALAILNDWNARKRFGKAFFDKDGDPNIDFGMYLHQGVAAENLRTFFRRVVRATARFDYAVITKLRALGQPRN